MPRLRNTKHERFAREIAALTPMQEAYRLAGFSGDERWFRFNASRLKNTPKVMARIEELRLQFEQLSAISADYVRHKLLGFVEFDVRDLYEVDPDDSTGKGLRLRPLNDLSERARKSIEKLKLDPETGRPVEITLAGRVSSATTLLRSLPGGPSDQGADASAGFIAEVRWANSHDECADNSVTVQAVTQAQTGPESNGSDVISRLKALAERSQK